MQENKFELNISSSETVDSLLRKIEAANGLALEGEHTVLIDGQPIDRQSGMPLASYISNGRATKLELVPCEPDVDALPEGSPSLHSPGHLLHQHWQVGGMYRDGSCSGSCCCAARSCSAFGWMQRVYTELAFAGRQLVRKTFVVMFCCRH
jgi:hypothetical protein